MVVVEGNRLTLQPTSINSIASFDEFHDLVQKENPEAIANFYEQFFTNKVAAIRTIIKMAEEKGFTFSAEEVQNYVRTMNENEEFAEIELTETALMSIAGGGRSRSNCPDTGMPGCQLKSILLLVLMMRFLAQRF